jgi:uncharacterized protein YciI
MSDTPPAAGLEPVWLLEMTYAPDAAETRVPFRGRHLARLLELMEAGVVIEAGAYADVSSSIVLLRAPDEEAALDIVRADIYMANGVWVEARARKFGRVVRPGVAGS